MDLERVFEQELTEEFKSIINFGEQSLTVFSLMLEAYLRALKRGSCDNFTQIQCAKILQNGIDAYFESKYEAEWKPIDRVCAYSDKKD
jgi:hypothetical protein